MAEDLASLRGLPRDESGPIFSQPWEAQAFAMTLALHERGLFTWSEWAQALGARIAAAQEEGDADLGDTYYHHWIAALENLIAAKGAASIGELVRHQKAWHRAAVRTPHGQPIDLQPRDFDTVAQPAGALQAILASQRAAFLAHPMPCKAERRRQLMRLKGALLSHREALAAALSRDFGGHSRDEALLVEIFPLVRALKAAIRDLGKWMRPSRRRVGWPFLPSRARVVYQPLGVIGIVTPWNYPVLLSLGPLIDIIAAGNRAMIKTSEFTPATAQVLKTMLAEVFPVDWVAVVTDDSGEAARDFGRLRFDHLVFTGSGRTGRNVMRAASDNLVPVTLELGGKSPVIIGEDAPIETAAERICWGKSLKSGQSCTAPDYVLCPRSRLEDLVRAFRTCYSRMFPALKDNPDCTSIINDDQYRRLLGLLDDAREKGARLEELNPAREDLCGVRKLPLVLVLGATKEMRVMQEEIFGPILPIVPYDRIDDAIACVNGHPAPLVLYLFSFDKALQRRVRIHTRSGAVSINDTMTHAGINDLPFGGLGESGMGRYHGREGFLAFSQARAVFSKGRMNTGRRLYAPYGRLAQRIALLLSLR
jgi:coniferyl-aldehyde dehydrogenase